MNKALKFIFIFFLTQFSAAQTETKADENFAFSLLMKEFENLNHGSDLFEKYPILKTKEINSIIGCIYLLNAKEDEIKKVAIARLSGISTQLFNQGKPVYLTSGMDSSYFANKENENLEDDNHIIYVSIAECVVSNSESTAQSVFNEQTMKLVTKKKPLTRGSLRLQAAPRSL